ncbi:MAG: hypothetical protein HOI53_08400 [Francisellaceae bacterium]|jgi:dihydrofolate synthase / folylpolyglutamate synthase|nr:hypothetical protein [Francisellaceae bacterium]MBT6208035.1 hypothetical protein [Francisellaceae bacterium]MBT6538941.1 hypothetical protein [Francisellaceae bacterium]
MDVQDLSSWIEYLERPDNCKIELSLDRVLQVAYKLNVTSFSCPVVTVAGTNGKGSCVATLEAIGGALNKRVGVFTSPHMHHFLERIRINNENVEGHEVCSALQKVHTTAESINIKLTYFEYVTMAALVIFKQMELDLIILEVGLGGRLDAVNVVDNTVGIITSISKDHSTFLGDTLDEIAREKAGILRKGSWAIFNEFENSVKTLKSVAKNVGSGLYTLGKDFSINEDSENWNWTNGRDSLLNLPLTDFPVQNAAMAVTASYLLYGEQITSSLINKVLSEVFVLGRYNKIIVNDAKFILDVAHNTAGASWLLQKVLSQNTQGEIRVIFQSSARKEWNSIIKMWKKNVNKWYFINTNNKDLTSSSELSAELESNNYTIVDNCNKAIELSASESAEKDVTVIFGSFHIVGLCLKETESLMV